MSGHYKYSKTEFINFVLADLDSVSATPESAREYLANEGIDVNRVLEEGRKRIRKVQLKLEALRTRSEMLSLESVKEKAIAWVDKLMAKKNFSFAEFITTEDLALQNRNIEGFTQDDIRNTLVHYYTLKFFEQKQQPDGSHEG